MAGALTKKGYSIVSGGTGEQQLTRLPLQRVFRASLGMGRTVGNGARDVLRHKGLTHDVVAVAIHCCCSDLRMRLKKSFTILALHWLALSFLISRDAVSGVQASCV